MASFPSIRAPLRDPWRASEPDGVRRTAMDAGPPKKRVESVAVGGEESFQFKLDDADAAALKAFYADNKALRFDLDHWVWGACEAEFAGPIAWSKRGRWHIADVRLEIFAVPAEE